MGLNSKLIKRITGSSTSDVVHSSGYAEVQNAGSFGASDNTTFSERQQIEQRRKYVQGYRNARIAQGVNHMPKALTADEQAQLAAEAAIMQAKSDSEMSRQEYNSHLEKGGLRRYDTRNKDSLGLQRSGTDRSQMSAARQTSAAGRQEAAAARAARAERFAGHAHPIPKTGGFGRY